MSITKIQSKFNLEKQPLLKENQYQQQHLQHQQQQQREHLHLLQKKQRYAQGNENQQIQSLQAEPNVLESSETLAKSANTFHNSESNIVDILELTAGPIPAVTTATLPRRPPKISAAKDTAPIKADAEGNIKQSPKALNPSTVKFASPSTSNEAILSNGLNNLHQQQLAQPQTYLPQAALLKIKPFVPSINTRLRRPISRSYSTLSTTTNQKRSTNVTVNPVFTRIETKTITNGCSSPLLVTPSNCGGTVQALDASVVDSNGGLVFSAAIIDVPSEKANRSTISLRRQSIKVVTRQRSKSTSSSASNSNRPATTALNNGSCNINATCPSKDVQATKTAITVGAANVSGTTSSNGGMTVVAQPNGICRITRHTKEQEKLPDRINYDRRGLTAIPIFENEANLRLLSLQHNLINIFHIPKEESPTFECCNLSKTRPEEEKIHSNNTQFSIGNSSGQVKLNRHVNINAGRNSKRLPLNLLNSPNATFNVNHENNTIILKNSFVSTSANQSQTQIQSIPLPTQPIGPANHLTKRGTVLQSLNYNSTQTQTFNAQQQQQNRPPHYRFPVKKSKSFITNYTRHFNNLKRNIQRPLLSKTDVKMVSLIGSTNLKSFDSGGSCITNTDSLASLINNDIGEEEDSNSLQMLEIKNRQLQSSYGIIFQNLVFLDLYDNQIERISNLDGLPVLSVLLLGKNRITDITGLASLKETLRVLDLHGNKITSISNKINCLRELKSLNLAGNQIRQINQNDFNGLLNLKELNLKRNRLRRINGFQHLTALERLWLCHNDLHKVEDMSSISKASGLQEVTIENNPVSLAGDCVSFLVSYLPNLQSLSQMPITDKVRRAANAWRKNKELSDSNASQHTSEVFNSIRREEVISNARTNWELLRSQQTVQITLSNQRASKQRELAKINESNEAVVSYEELQEYIKLPPIEQQKQSKHQQRLSPKRSKQENTQDTARHSGSSGSSLGPNVDSSSSYYSSENDESDKKKLLNTKAGKRRKNDCRSTPTKSVTTPRGEKIAEHNTHTDKGLKSSEDIDKNIKTNDSVCSAIPALNENLETNSLRDSSNSTSMLLTANANNNAAKTILTSNQYLHLPSHSQYPSLSQSPTPTTLPISAMASYTTSTGILCLGYQQNGIKTSPLPSPTHNTSPIALSTVQQTIFQHTSTTTTFLTNTAAALPVSTNTSCRRYMRSSLMRSQTISGASGVMGNNNNNIINSKVKSTIKTQANIPQAFQQQQQHHLPSNVNGICNSQSNCSIVTLASTSVNNTSTLATGITANGNNVTISSLSKAISVTSETVGLTTSIETTASFLESAVSDNCSSAISSAGMTSNLNVTSTLTSSISPMPTMTLTPSLSSQQSTATVQQPTKPTAIEREREREQGGDYLIEICGRYLNIYGQGALRFIDKQWNPSKANDVHTLNFSYINFNNITSVLARIKVRFPHAENFVFRETNITCLGQLNALAELQGITSLFIDPEGNPITTKDLWRHYAVYRLSHWGLKLLNGVEVSESEVDEANIVYAGLSDLVLWSMPNIMLQPLLARLRLDETCTASKMSPKEWLMKPDNKSLRLVVGKEALQWKKPSNNSNATGATIRDSTVGIAGNIYGHQQLQQQQQQHHLYLNCHQQKMNETLVLNSNTSTSATISTSALSIRERGKLHFTAMMENTCNAIEKLHKLETLWPSLLLDIIRNTLLDYAQLDTYLRNLMAELMK